MKQPEPTTAGSTGTFTRPSPFPASRKVYETGSRPDVRVPMREITLADTRVFDGSTRRNPALRVYDTSGPYTDPSVETDPARGIAPLRAAWIAGRGDTEELPDFSSPFSRERWAASAAPGAAPMPLRRLPRRACAGRCPDRKSVV